MGREELIRHLEEDSQVLQSAALKDAFTAIDRANFLEEDYRSEAYEDYAVPIGFDETLTKPTTAAFMLELLDPQEAERVLNVGAGSGWTTALLAKLVGDDGYVWATEIVPELVERSRENLKKAEIGNALIVEATRADIGFPQDEPYDRILVHGSVSEIPAELVEQLKPGGVMVLPINDALVRVERVNDEEIEEQTYGDFIFNPLKTLEPQSEQESHNEPEN